MTAVRLPSAPVEPTKGANNRQGGDLNKQIEQMREMFPNPVASPKDDAYVMWSLLRGMNVLGAMKNSHRPYFGKRLPLESGAGAGSNARRARDP